MLFYPISVCIISMCVGISQLCILKYQTEMSITLSKNILERANNYIERLALILDFVLSVHLLPPLLLLLLLLSFLPPRLLLLLLLSFFLLREPLLLDLLLSLLRDLFLSFFFLIGLGEADLKFSWTFNLNFSKSWKLFWGGAVVMEKGLKANIGWWVAFQIESLIIKSIKCGRPFTIGLSEEKKRLMV